MKLAALLGCVMAVLVRVTSLAAADPAAEDRTVSPKFVIYASADDAEFGSSLFRVLRSKGERARFDQAETIEQALASTADVMVLVLPKREVPKLAEGTLESLKKRKIVGIGYGAAQLFGQLGLEINGGACAHGVNGPPSVVIGKSELLGEPKTAEPLKVLQDAAKAPPDGKLDVFAAFLPPRGPNASVVDVIARWTTDPNYAPVVRQGNCVLIGIPIPATQWTAAYANLIRETCLALHERQLEPFSTARRELTKAGAYEFTLAERNSIDSPFEKTFYFHFTEPVQFNAQLDHAGSESVMLIFMGQDEAKTHWTRQDACEGETLKIATDIRGEDISKLGDRYWTLNVTNFGTKAPAQCKLTITIEKP